VFRIDLGEFRHRSRRDSWIAAFGRPPVKLGCFTALVLRLQGHGQTLAIGVHGGIPGALVNRNGPPQRRFGFHVLVDLQKKQTQIG
jgi:hypothetical protein